MTVLIVEDDGLHRRYIHDIVARHFEGLGEIVEATCGEEVDQILPSRAIAYSVLDLQMYGVSGIDVARRLWRFNPECKILFWSNYADEPYVRGVTRIVPPKAVYGYLLKSADEERLIYALRGVFMEDQCVIDREVRGVQSRTQDRVEGLTDVDYEILYDISVGLTDKAISLRRKLSTRGVQSRLQSLYEKLISSDEEQETELYSSTFNTRTRIICLAIIRGLLSRDALTRENDALTMWIKRRPH